jgi:hypothetical protein
MIAHNIGDHDFPQRLNNVSHIFLVAKRHRVVISAHTLKEEESPQRTGNPIVKTIGFIFIIENEVRLEINNLKSHTLYIRSQSRRKGIFYRICQEFASGSNFIPFRQGHVTFPSSHRTIIQNPEHPLD